MWDWPVIRILFRSPLVCLSESWVSTILGFTSMPWTSLRNSSSFDWFMSNFCKNWEVVLHSVLCLTVNLDKGRFRDWWNLLPWFCFCEIWLLLTTFSLSLLFLSISSINLYNRFELSYVCFSVWTTYTTLLESILSADIVRLVIWFSFLVTIFSSSGLIVVKLVFLYVSLSRCSFKTNWYKVLLCGCFKGISLFKIRLILSYDSDTKVWLKLVTDFVIIEPDPWSLIKVLNADLLRRESICL